MARTLLFGGSFNPIHHGHLIVARAVAERLHVDRIVLLPGAKPPHKSAGDLAETADRLALARLAVTDDPLFEVSDWEAVQPGPNYTLHTVRHFRAQLPEGAWLGWLIGMDSLIELPTWHRVGELARLCTIVTAARPGFDRPDLREHRKLIDAADLQQIVEHILPTPQIEISSTGIRSRLRAGRSVRYLVPPAVAVAIEQRGLYRDG